MTLRIKSALLSRTNSIKRPNFNGLKDTFRAHRPNIADNVSYGSNEYIHKSFFEDDNFQSIIKCLDGGYEVSKDLIESMQDYCNLQQEHAHQLTSYSKKCKSKLKQQSSLSSYHTTKHAQLQTVRLPEKLAQLIQSRCDAMQQVIATYRKQVERMYPSERLGTLHKHYRTDTMKKSFKTARSSVSKISDKLEKLREQEKRARDALHDADVQCQNLSLDPTTSKNKLTRANDNQEKKQDELKDIEDKISRTEKEYDQEQETYREKAMGIYQQCRELEKERLDQIRETLIKFTQAAHSSDYSAAHDAVYEDLLSNIKTEQDSIEDLDFWARTYHVNILNKSISSETNKNDDDDADTQTTTQKPKKSHKNDTENLTTAELNTQQSVAENVEEQPVKDATTTSTKTKGKKNKNTTSTEKKSNTTTEPTTPSAT